MAVELSLIVAMSENGCIGSNGDLPWPRIKEDMRFFRETTTGSSVIMGRKTYESIGSKGLPLRKNVVISSSHLANINTAIDFRSAVDQCFHGAFAIGGSRVYSDALNYDNLTTMYITRIHKNFEGDTFFPDYDKSKWRIESHRQSYSEDCKCKLTFEKHVKI